MATPPPIYRQPSAKVLETIHLENGMKIWIPGSEQVWEGATVMAIGDLKVTVRTAQGRIQQVDRGLALPLNPRVCDDMTSLYYIHEPGILYNLEERAQLDNQRPYTFMANVLIAVNPLQALPNPSVDKIVNSSNCSPHPYAIAEIAYQQMAYNSSAEMPTNQSVVISGESGAGKTESSKIVLKHLTTRGVYGKLIKAADMAQQEKNRPEHGTSLDHRLIEQNPILEAFGNAKTLRNHNSSRFGKFMKLQFSSDGQFKLAGAMVETYLLEKSRLVYQVYGERNFHIFYQLLSGASADMRKLLHLGKPQDYKYLNQSGCYEAEDTDDKKCFESVLRGLSCVGISDSDQQQILGMVSALLHIGNIAFGEEETSEGQAAILDPKSPIAKESLELCAKLLGVKSDYLLKVITEREIITKGEVFTVRRNAQNAVYSRDAIAKSLYDKLFDYIIKRVNISLDRDPAPLPSIGVLDIFGFESFQRNDFEQLLINYTNEVLQATFNKQVFIAEMELYKREGITVGKIEWPDNRECVELIGGKPNGILQILDNEAMTQKPNDEKFLSTLHKTHANNKYFPRPHPKDMSEIFIVRHFAGLVSYTVGAFIDKNNDTIPKDMFDLFLSSNSSLMSGLFKDEVAEAAAAGSRNAQPTKKLKSVASKFSKQMQDLVNTLDATRCNFIRCIKPNAMMKLGYFDPRYVVGQLRCQGVMQTAQVLKVGLPTRVSYEELVGAYKKFMPPDAQRLFSNQSDATLITAILWAFEVPMNSYKLGITKLFFKAGEIAILDSILKINWAVDGPRIVKRMKLWLARRRWRVALAKVLGQIAWKQLYRRLLFRKDAVRMIQVWWRGFSVRKAFLRKRAAAVAIQSAYRGHNGRIAFKVKKQEMIALAATRAKEARQKAEEARQKQEEARIAAEQARREAEFEAAADEERQRIEEEARKAEEEAMALAKIAQLAIQEAEEAAAAAAAAVEAERLAEQRAIREVEELKKRILLERSEAQKKKEEALLNAAKISANILGGLAQVTTMTGASGDVIVIDIPDTLSQENQEQLRQLNDLLLSGAISQSEYDELVPFLLKEEESGRAQAFTSEQQEGLDRLYNEGLYGIQIRCPACGTSNNTANGNHCTECGSTLTATTSASDHKYYGYRTRSMSSMSMRDVNLSAPGTFQMEGQRVKIHDGYFMAQMHGTQILADENYAEYTVYVLRCSWQPGDAETPTYWLISHRFSEFEKLHRDLKYKIPPHIASLPQFPKKHVLSGVFKGKTGTSDELVEERKKGLERYINEVIDMCARLPDTLSVPELDRFLNLSHNVKKIKRELVAIEEVKENENVGDYSMENVGGAENLAARERSRLPTELPNPLDEEELTHTEQAVEMLNQSIRTSQGDLRRNHQVQHLLKICVQLQPRLHMSASLDNPFADVDLIPRAMQCQEDLEMTMSLYNDCLLAVSQTYEMSADAGAPPAAPITHENDDA